MDADETGRATAGADVISPFPNSLYRLPFRGAFGILYCIQKWRQKMASTTVRISDKAHATLKRLAEKTGTSLQEVMEQALEKFRREYFWKEANSAFAHLREDPQAWQAELAERNQWDQTLLDGLEAATPSRQHPTRRKKRG
jgi:predicted transcriptional regulator